ncbi:MAG TPA: S1/P1 nuclease [Verrucomicrobiae bacterium]|nr:S1/P1 nuclease [Verrucomicrobiae bacterium]
MKFEFYCSRAKKYSVLLVAVCALCAPAAWAWNNVGHRAVAELAWRRLDASQRKAASDLLKQHPHYQQLLLKEYPGGVSKDEWAFLMAAIWPDRIRPPKHGGPEKPLSITKYDLYPHALGLPIIWPEDTTRVTLAKFHIRHPNAAEALSNCVVCLQDTAAPAADRAVSLCWVLHLIGDLHQPLHDANVVSPRKPAGEGLGGAYIVCVPGGERENLHVFWDALPGTEPTYRSISRVADEIEKDPALQRANLKEYKVDKSIESWVREGRDVVESFAYSPKHVKFARESDLKSGKISRREVPQLTADYVREAREIAMRRLALASWRLSDVLNDTWKE